MRRRSFLKGCGVVGATLVAGSFACAQPGDPIGLSVGELKAGLADGRLTPGSVLDAFLGRIEEWDPRLGSIIELNPQLAPREGSGSLAGIPVLLKDNIATADAMTTSAGSAALEGSRYPHDSGIARRLREAGAVLLGKTNMSEWANFRSDNSTSGWSARGGQCRNPYVLDRSPCGSSSGSAVAVAAGLAPLAVGTETVGSIVCPSGTCGIVGLKPTVGLLPADHIIPIATTWDTAGPMARTVSDAAALLGALANQEYSLNRGALEGVRLGVARDYFGFDWRVDQLLERELQVLESLGATIVDPVGMPSWGELGPVAFEVMLYEFKAGVNQYLADQSEEMEIRTLAQVIAFNQRHPELEKLDFLGQHVLLQAQAKGPLREQTYRDALAASRRLSDFDQVFLEHKLDAVLGPTNGMAWTIDLVNGDHFEGGSAGAAAVGGYPHLTVPAGYLHELPIGLSMIGPRGSDEQLLNLGFDYEQATQHRKEPRFLPTLSAS